MRIKRIIRKIEIIVLRENCTFNVVTNYTPEESTLVF